MTGSASSSPPGGGRRGGEETPCTPGTAASARPEPDPPPRTARTAGPAGTAGTRSAGPAGTASTAAVPAAVPAPRGTVLDKDPEPAARTAPRPNRAGRSAIVTAASPANSSARRHAPSRRGGVLAVGLLLSLVGLVVTVWASLLIGTGDVGTADISAVVLDRDLDQRGQLLLWEVRIPRTVAGLLAGAALGLAGAVMQGVARNPLADPGILGVNAGASVVIVFAISVLGLTESGQYIWFGFGGALAAAVLVYGVGSLGRDGATPVKLALAGAATSAVLGSLTTAMLLTDSRTFDQFRFWQVGSLTGRNTDVLWQALPFIVVGITFALSLGGRLNALSLGDDMARALGQRVGLARVVAAASVVLLCGGAVAIAGPIAFVGLLIAHAARTVTGPDYRWILPYSAVLAPVLMLWSDILGRLIAPPGEVQVGVVTAAIGAVPFVILVRRRKVAEL